jgi:hypothetical protein
VRSPHWTVPRAHEGATVAILASGPSMSQAVADAVHAAGIPAIAINSTFRLAPWADVLYAADPEWWAHPSNRDALVFKGLRLSCQPMKAVLQLRNSGVTGFDPDPAAVRTGGNSGYQALHVAIHAGAARVLLCGYDMHGGHWHGKHPAGLKETTPRPTRAGSAVSPTWRASRPSVGSRSRTARPGRRCGPSRCGTLEKSLPRALNLLRQALPYRREAFDAGLRAAGFDLVSTLTTPRPDDVLLIWNRYAGFAEQAVRFEWAGAKVVIAENGWLGKGWRGGEWFALSLGHHAGAGKWKDGGPERWDSLGRRVGALRRPAAARR